MKRFHRLARRALALMMPAVVLALGACNEKSESSSTYTPSSSVAITSFRLRQDVKVMANLDSVFFSIDLEHGVIFNADSLPQGTDVTRLVPVIVYPKNISSASIQSIGGKYEETVNYKKHPTDSIDFSGDTFLTLTAEDGKTSATYRLKVNVHKSNPDLMMWDELAVRDLPSRSGSPVRQKTISKDNKAYTLLREPNGTMSLAVSGDLMKNEWTVSDFNPGFDPRIASFSASDKGFYLLSADGILYESTDAVSWSSTGEEWITIIGGYGDWILGLKSSSTGTILHTAWPAGKFEEKEADYDFPIEDISNFTLFHNKWATLPIGTLVGGEKIGGGLSDATWAFDGTTWAILSEGKIPGLRGATVIPYFGYLKSSTLWIQTEYTTWLLMGGLKTDGSVNETTYISYDYGVNWHPADSSFQMPESFKPLYGADQVVMSTPLSASLSDAWTKVANPRPAIYRKIPYQIDDTTIHWDCPYIYTFGGYLEGGIFYPRIRRGVLARLTFAPII